MKQLTQLSLVLLMLSACGARTGRTVCTGKVIFPDSLAAQPYYALVPNLDKDRDCEPWKRFEPWEDGDFYNIQARPGQTLHCMWLAKCGHDTLAQLTLKGIPGKQKLFNDTLVLDGSHYYRGTKHEKR